MMPRREDAVDVELDGVVGDAEALRDFLVGKAGGEEAQHFALARRQRLDHLDLGPSLPQ